MSSGLTFFAADKKEGEEGAYNPDISPPFPPPPPSDKAGQKRDRAREGKDIARSFPPLKRERNIYFAAAGTGIWPPSFSPSPTKGRLFSPPLSPTFLFIRETRGEVEIGVAGDTSNTGEVSCLSQRCKRGTGDRKQLGTKKVGNILFPHHNNTVSPFFPSLSLIFGRKDQETAFVLWGLVETLRGLFSL